jgi:hypothetical protein
MTSYEYEKNYKQDNVTNIYLEQCVKKLKRQNTIRDILIFKIDLKKELTNTYYTLYEFINPRTHQTLDLSICENFTLILNKPIQFDNNDLMLYKYNMKYNFDIFNYKNTYYHDYCLDYININDQNMLIKERKNLIYNDTITLCEIGCEYIDYNIELNRINCKCPIINYDMDFDQTYYYKLDFNHVNSKFYENDKYYNFIVFKCNKQVFNFKYLKYNIVHYIFTSIFIISIISIIFYNFIHLPTFKNNVEIIIIDKPSIKRIKGISSPPPRTQNKLGTK